MSQAAPAGSDPAGYVVVQAGGRGSRLRHHTWNKPKCLVPVRGKPLLYHSFDRFPDHRFIVIGDYQFEKLRVYLETNRPHVDYELIQAQGSGTLAGVGEALARIPPESSVILVWSDLILTSQPKWPQGDELVVCTTSAFTCRWSVSEEGRLSETPSDSTGVPGLFFLPRADLLSPIPTQGEFVRWLSDQESAFSSLRVDDLEELGEFASIESANEAAGFSRFFNRVEVGEKVVTKTVIDDRYMDLQVREIDWYEAAQSLGFRNIPTVISKAPLTLSRIHGWHPFQMDDLTGRERRAIIANVIDSLGRLHGLGSQPADSDALHSVYVTKTLDRVNSVRNLIPGFDSRSMVVNGRKCINPFSGDAAEIFGTILASFQAAPFTPIHGDPTFSNTLIDKNLRPWLIDPRGYFREPGIFGDPWYDFAKLYYSAIGGYDAFNRRKFKLHIDGGNVEVLMEESRFLHSASEVFDDLFGVEIPRLRFVHSMIWLSLSGYSIDDIDSVIASFYLGVYWYNLSLDVY